MSGWHRCQQLRDRSRRERSLALLSRMQAGAVVPTSPTASTQWELLKPERETPVGGDQAPTLEAAAGRRPGFPPSFPFSIPPSGGRGGGGKRIC